MNELTTIDEETGEVFSAPIAQMPAIDQGEINMQIATARAYPRSTKQVASRILDLVTLDEESAEECIYALPRGGKPIKGPSIRFAEALKQSFGNCRSAARVVEVNKVEKYIEAEGVFFDLETNTATSARVRRRISTKTGALLNDDMILVTGNAACSIAMRNAILGGIPKPIWRRAYEAANAVLTGDVVTLAENREKAFKGFAAFGVKPEQIFAALAINGAEDITVDQIGLLRGMYATLKNGESTVEEMFAPPVSEKKSDPTYNPLEAAAQGQKAPTGDKPEAKAKPAAEGDSAKLDEKRSATKAPSHAVPDLDEARRQGNRAALAGDDREAPADAHPDEQAAWLEAFDKTTAEANES